MRFKLFLLNEQQAYLGQKVGDILTATQELRDDVKNMGSRDLIRFSERIVNNIRRILHSNWPKEEKKHLAVLQKVGVALMKAIEEKDDLASVISGSASTLEKLVSDLGIPIHKLATTDKPEEQDKTTTDKTQSNQSNQAGPPQSQTLDVANPTGDPGSGQNLTAPPLGDNGTPGSLEAF